MATVLERWENPGGIGNRTSSITVTTTLTFTGAGPINNFVDGDFSDSYAGSVEIASAQTTGVIKFDFGSGVTKKILSWLWHKSSNASEGSWKLAGSNDDATYFDITPAVVTDKLGTLGQSNGVNDDFYRYYKMIQTAGFTNGSPWNRELEFRIEDSGSADDRTAITPSYSNFLGSGFRPYIVISGTTVWNGLDPSGIIDGLNSNVAWLVGAQTGTYIEFDFLEDVLITELTWLQSGATSQGDWKWQAYDDATTSWIDLTSSFNLGSASATTVITAMSAVTDYYTKYRLQQVTGSTSSSPYVQEITFKLGHPAISFSPSGITNISPDEGDPAGGDAITITGAGFTGATDVTFDGTSATSIVVVDDNTITCVNPSHASGPVDVIVYTPGGDYTATAGFLYFLIGVRVTQAPILTLDLSPQPTRVSQVPILIFYQEEQPNRVTQAPLLVMYTPKPVPLPAPIVPEMPLIESWGFLTVLGSSQQGQEARARLREVPRYKLQMKALILNEDERRATYNMLMRFLKTPFLYPMFQYNTEITAASAITDTKIFADTALTDLRDGETIALFDPYLERVHYIETTTVDSDGVNLAAPLPFDVPAYWQICPAIPFRIMPGVGFNMRAIDGSFSLTMESVQPRVFQRPGAVPTLTTIDGILIVPERPLANEDVPENFDMGNTWFDNKTSVPDVLNEWSNPRVMSKISFNFDRKTTIDYWRAIADEVKGRQGVALFPTFRDDLPLREDIALNVSKFTTFNIDFYLWWLDLRYRYIMLTTANGVKYRRIIDVTPHYNGEGNPDYLNITLSTSIGNVAGDNVISSISYMNLFRLDDDNIKLTHYPLETEIELSIKATDK